MDSVSCLSGETKHRYARFVFRFVTDLFNCNVNRQTALDSAPKRLSFFAGRTVNRRAAFYEANE